MMVERWGNICKPAWDDISIVARKGYARQLFMRRNNIDSMTGV